MPQSSYDESLRRVLWHEGGYVNHPSDPGGETNRGITVAVARQNGYHGPMRDIPMDVVKAIYKAKYWDALRCDDLPPGVDYAVFDYGVNSGIGRSAKVLQRVTGVPDDGRIGPATLAAVAQRDPAALVKAICDERLAFLHRLSTWDTFGNGWSRRVAEVRNAALTMARRTSPAEEQSGVPTAAPGKGEVARVDGQIKGAVAGGGGATAAAGASLWDWVMANPRAAVLIGAGCVLAIAFAVHSIKAARARRQDAPVPGIAVVPVAA